MIFCRLSGCQKKWCAVFPAVSMNLLLFGFCVACAAFLSGAVVG
jgi:hypothetical protein